MSPRVFLIWLAVTVVTVVLAVVVGLGRETATFDLVKREPVFEALRENPDAATRIEIKSRFDEFLLVREADGWVTPDRADYPVDEADVRRLIAGLTDMRYIEPKTSNPERFSRLELQDIDEELADSAYVKVMNAQEAILAELIVGRPSARFFEGRASGTYIRFPGTTETWLVSGVTNVQTRLIPWLQREIVSVPANTVARVSVGAGEGAYTISRSDADSAFEISGAPAGRELDEDKAISASRAIAGVELEDVELRSEFALPEDAAVAEVVTFDGIAVRARLAEIDRKRWAAFEAEYVGAEDAENAQAARDRVAAINARVGPWVYWVPSATYTNLTRSLDDVLVAEQPDAS